MYVYVYVYVYGCLVCVHMCEHMYGTRAVRAVRAVGAVRAVRAVRAVGLMLRVFERACLYGGCVCMVDVFVCVAADKYL